MSNKPLFAFFGTPKFSVHVLDALESQGMLPALVITAPDRPQGRGLVLTPSPAKQWAMERGIDVLTPEKLKDEAFLEELQNTEWDVFLVAAYAKLIPKNILDMPRRGCLNVHPSLLPKFRGPSPAASAILADERATGVTIMQMAEKMDAGPIVAQARIELEEEAWPPKGSEFETLLATEGGNLLAETIPHWVSGQIDAEPQDESAATFTRKFTDADSLIDIHGDPREQLLKIRTFDKNPRAHFIKNGKRVIITEADIKDGALEILRVIPEGKKEMSYVDLVRTLPN
ncbi:methionyl-tRNA formyltransferase [Candidatus Adlerbacteria bacterium RIFOXYC1_FULL_48_26]|uniref:methionyl-tRNA formyltransferase n=1 Tax=Candidatus Adlerbacteria bacterium RIFOXYC1_FULL_48_26 TaxID=1797247 RepID=A0A1F4Y5M3_9BACT|nr:MAG: methionyl-tRNA formyltransferase [Candidatus Adlerbacteria bacterium RIFOXYC1_FULL_48_26]OGC94844.1 MAG: methionyl-tRNA formyltransferase [Candidatus Adlerbacteria bacterium RIFOXYD1_FULL_48_8]